MAINYSTAVKADRMTATRDYFANGTLELLDGAVVVATFGLSASGGTVSGDTWTIGLDSNAVDAIAAGNTDAAQLKTSGGTVGLDGLTVGTSGADITIGSATISIGQKVLAGITTIQHS